jgi:lysozyme family protein
MDIKELIADIIAREGGYVNHPADRGGATRWGITEAVARAHGWRGEMRAFPEDEAARIYERIYWIRPGFDRIAKLAPQVGAELFDTGVNMGPSVAVAFLQRALNALNRGATDYPDLVPAARVDDATAAALAAFLEKRKPRGESVLVKALDALQGERYLDLAERRPANETFLYGWLANRLG